MVVGMQHDVVIQCVNSSRTGCRFAIQGLLLVVANADDDPVVVIFILMFNGVCKVVTLMFNVIGVLLLGDPDYSD